MMLTDLVESTDFINQVRNHFVGLSGKCVRENSSGGIAEEKNFAFSAFVIEIRGVWCLVTAGHVINDIEVVVKHPEWKLHRCGLADFFSLNPKVKEPTPFPFETTHKIHVDQDGMDIGLIPLPDFYRHSLQGNNVEPIPVAAWRSHSPPACDAYALLGLPAEHIQTIEASASRGSGQSVLLAMVPVIPCPFPPEKITSNIPRFAATLFDGGELDSVKGMSGGPIIGIRRKEGGSLEYACVAVQGEWNRRDRMIFGTPVSMVVGVIESLLENGAS